jgi:hypothetical protein
MKVRDYGGMQVWFRSFLALALDDGKWSHSRLGPFTPGDMDSMPRKKEAQWAPQPVWTLQRRKKSYAPAGNGTTVPHYSSKWQQRPTASVQNAFYYKSLQVHSNTGYTHTNSAKYILCFRLPQLLQAPIVMFASSSSVKPTNSANYTSLVEMQQILSIKDYKT